MPVALATRWKDGVVTSLPSERSVEVGGVPRHIADVRAVPGSESDSASSDATLPMVEETGGVTPRRRGTASIRRLRDGLG